MGRGGFLLGGLDPTREDGRRVRRRPRGTVDGVTAKRHDRTVRRPPYPRFVRNDEDGSRVTIVKARYGGIYEPGKWLAFGGGPRDLPQEWDAEDNVCMDFWRERRGEVGGGDTPDEALADLLDKGGSRRG
jgi:hypothetical protein